MQGSQPHWRYLFEERFGEATALQEDAAKLASGWQRLYAARHAMEKESQPWQRPTRFEVEAAGEHVAQRLAACGAQCAMLHAAAWPDCVLPARPAAPPSAAPVAVPSTCQRARLSLTAVRLPTPNPRARWPG